MRITDLFSKGQTSSSEVRVVVVSIFFAAILLFVIELVLRSSLLWKLSPALLVSNSKDDWAAVSHKIVNIDPGNGIYPIVMLGGSSARELITDNPKLDRELFTAIQRETEFTNLASSSQSIAETLVLADQLKATDEGSAILGVNPYLFLKGMDDIKQAQEGFRFPFSSPSLDGFFDDSGIQRCFFCALHVHRYRDVIANWFSRRAESKDYFDLIDYAQHYYDSSEPLTDRRLKRLEREIREKYLKHYESNAAINDVLMERVISVLAGKGYRVSLINVPRNPDSELNLSTVIGKYRQILGELQQSSDIHFWDAHKELVLGGDSFYDHIHLTQGGREQFRRTLLSEKINDLTGL
ncbi:MAG: hypothetical protein AAF402_11290 [Pseudomonadota bacterium]